jgi:hypothetical protein
MIMKKLFIITISIIAVGLTGCLKDQFGTNLYATGKPLLEFEYPQGGGGNDIGSGLEYFGGGALLYPPTDVSDTTFFIVNLASTNTLGSSLGITIGADSTALEANYSNDSITYVEMPDSDYSFLTTSGTIPAGQRQDTFYIVFYPNKIDPTKNYGLPITVLTNTQNIPVSGNFGHIYIHTIGNIIAGLYNQEWIRYNTATQTGTPAYDETGQAIFAPDNPTQIEVTSGTGVNYILDFVDSAGIATDFTVSFPSSGPYSATGVGITINNGPTIVQANFATGTYEFNFIYTNGSGAQRNITDIFTK